MTASELETLTQINLDDLAAAFGWQKIPLLTRLLRKVFLGPAKHFAENMLEFDHAIAAVGIGEAARQHLRQHYVQGLRVHGREQVPSDGPVLFLSNHPGMTDTLCLFAAIHRSDLKIIATDRPFLATLPVLTRQLFFISEIESERVRAVRQVTTHLKSGGAALTFPAGEIEPDPAVHTDAKDWLAKWVDSAGIFIRFARDTRIVPVVVRGVVSDRALRHPLTMLKSTRKEKERLAVALQILPMMTRNLRPTTPRVSFARPITLDEIGSTETSAIHRVVLSRMRELLENPLMDDGVSVL